MASLFTRIVKGEIPCQKILEDDKFLGFLDIRPIKPGHALVIPKEEIDYLFDIDDYELGELMRFAKKVAIKIEKAVPCKRIGVMIAGLEVPHAHIHLIPMDGLGDLNFANAKPVSSDELAEMAEKIRGE